jgi:hypothetical protein
MSKEESEERYVVYFCAQMHHACDYLIQSKRAIENNSGGREKKYYVNDEKIITTKLLDLKIYFY